MNTPTETEVQSLAELFRFPSPDFAAVHDQYRRIEDDDIPDRFGSNEYQREVYRELNEEQRKTVLAIQNAFANSHDHKNCARVGNSASKNLSEGSSGRRSIGQSSSARRLGDY
ncbi:MAG: hypothetical protein AAB853_05100 [Patescibacteria group bacterium]